MNTTNQPSNSQAYIDREEQYGAHNYHPLPVVLSRGEGVHVWPIQRSIKGIATPKSSPL